MACSTIVEYSQQEGFYRVPLPVTHQTPNLEDQWFRTFQLSPPGAPHVWNDASEPQQRKVELWATNCREFCRKWQLPRHFWVLLHAVNLRHGTDGFTSPPEGRRAVDFFARKIRRLRPGLNPRTCVYNLITLIPDLCYFRFLRNASHSGCLPVRILIGITWVGSHVTSRVACNKTGLKRYYHTSNSVLSHISY